MWGNRGDTRHAGYFGERRRGGLAGNEAYKPQTHDGHYISAQRISTQQGCRDYWAAVYGRQAEIASRGGVGWLR